MTVAVGETYRYELRVYFRSVFPPRSLSGADKGAVHKAF
jgi:hypothetical protein